MTCGKPFARPLSRRAVLASATALSLAPMGVTGPSARAASDMSPSSDPFDTLRDRWRTMMTGGDLDAGDAAYLERIAEIDAAAEARWRTFDADAGRTALWPDLPPGGPEDRQLQQVVRRVAHARPGLGHARHEPPPRPDGRQLLVEALQFLYDHAYNETLERQDSNWPRDEHRQHPRLRQPDVRQDVPGPRRRHALLQGGPVRPGRDVRAQRHPPQERPSVREVTVRAS